MYNLNRNSGVSLRSTLEEVGCVRPPLSIFAEEFRYKGCSEFNKNSTPLQKVQLFYSTI